MIQPKTCIRAGCDRVVKGKLKRCYACRESRQRREHPGVRELKREPNPYVTLKGWTA